jgi:acyl-CoA thioesterase-2
VNLQRLLTLEPHGADVYVGTGPRYPWGGLYGGQIVAQALRAATSTVPEQFHVHSLHAYFIRRGDHAEPIRFEVDRVRNGRSFVTRHVVARQAVGAILSMSASFQADEDAPAMQIATMPDIAPPDLVTDSSWTPMFERRIVAGLGGGRAAAWLRLEEPLDGDRALHAAALAYLSDDIPTDAVATLHPEYRPSLDAFESTFVSASLDHAIWFHRPVHIDGWHLHDLRCHGLLSSRGLAVGHVFDADGTHVATVSQEVLLRTRRPR